VEEGREAGHRPGSEMAEERTVRPNRDRLYQRHAGDARRDNNSSREVRKSALRPYGIGYFTQMGAGFPERPFCSVGCRPPLIGTPVRGKGCEVRPPRIASYPAAHRRSQTCAHARSHAELHALRRVCVAHVPDSPSNPDGRRRSSGQSRFTARRGWPWDKERGAKTRDTRSAPRAPVAGRGGSRLLRGRFSRSHMPRRHLLRQRPLP
jgi:hypothetical protein